MENIQCAMNVALKINVLLRFLGVACKFSIYVDLVQIRCPWEVPHTFIGTQWHDSLLNLKQVNFFGGEEKPSYQHLKFNGVRFTHKHMKA